MTIIRAEHLGMCFGVRDAIAMAFKTAEREPVTILGDLVHNETVLAELRAKGIQIRQIGRMIRYKPINSSLHLIFFVFQRFSHCRRCGRIVTVLGPQRERSQSTIRSSISRAVSFQF